MSDYFPEPGDLDYDSYYGYSGHDEPHHKPQPVQVPPLSESYAWMFKRATKAAEDILDDRYSDPDGNTWDVELAS